MHVDTWMMSRENCFLCFAQHGHRFENVCEIISNWKVKARRRSLPGDLLTKKTNGEMEAKRVLDQVENV